MYLLFLPDRRATNIPDLLQAAGLADLSPDGAGIALEIPVGPTNGRGTLVAFGDPITNPHRLAYSPDHQTWRPAKCARRGSHDPVETAPYYLGRNTDLEFSPASIARPNQHLGTHVTLADGNEYLIPIARQLPHTLGLDDDGNFVERVKPPYAAFCARSEQIFQQLATSVDNQLSMSDGFSYAVAALALNYRLNADLIDFLDLIDRDNFPRILGATIELELIRTVEAQKKTADVSIPATSASSSGSTALPPSDATSPPGLTSTS